MTLDPATCRVLALAATGLTTAEIACRLGLAREAVRERLDGAIRDLGARSRMEAVIVALRQGIISGEE